jgi:formylglycine-generating enzyme required for sulfatase activity
VWEWSWDGHDVKYYSTSPGADPLGPSGAAARVIRGGSWDYGPLYGRAAYRFRIAPGARYDFLGFRVARSGP